MRKRRVWSLDRYKDNNAVIDEYDNRVTYGELETQINDLADIVGHRCFVFSLCTNTMGSVVGYIGFLNNGIVPVMASARLDEALLDNLLDITTSGSTGSPKLVRQSYANILDNATSIVEFLKLDSTERPITTLPMYYVYGLSIINSHFLVGATLLLTDKRLKQEEFWDFFREKKATSFGGVPYTYETLDKLGFYGMELPSLRTMTQFDEDGFYYIVGRKKRFLKIHGHRISLDEIDRMIKGKYSIEVASAGVDDHVYIFLTDNKYADEVKEYLIEKTKRNPAAFKVIVIEEIPKNDSGKTLYKELEKYYTT